MLYWTHEQTWYIRCGWVVAAMACVASSHSTQHPAPSTQHTQITVVHRTLGLALHSLHRKFFSSQISLPRKEKPERAASKVEWLLTALGGQHELSRIESSSANQSISQIGSKRKAAHRREPRAQHTLHSNGATTEGATAVPHRECLCSTYKRRHQIDNINNSHFTPLLYY
jgi:ribosomal protein L32